MKKFFAILMASLLLVSAFALVASADTKDFSVAIGNGAGDDPYGDGAVLVYKNETDAEAEWENNFGSVRYNNVLICDADGKIVAIGNNLVHANDSFQKTVKVPANGYVVAFSYFDSGDPANTNNKLSNTGLWGLYQAALAAEQAADETVAAPGNSTIAITKAALYVTVDDTKVYGSYSAPVTAGSAPIVTPADGPYADGAILVYPNETDAEATWNNDFGSVAYNWVLVCDADGKVVQIGNNLRTNLTQTTLTVPANGYVVAFCYWAGDGRTANQGLMNLYNNAINNCLGGTAIYNETKAIDGSYYVVVDGETLRWDTAPIDLGSDVAPGDASNVIVFAILAIVAIAGSAVVVKTRR